VLSRVSEQTVLAAKLPAAPGWSAFAVAMLVVLVTFGWQIAGLIAIQRGDFIDENKLRLRSAGVQEAGMGLEQVAALHLFGDITANTVAPPPTTQDLPKTDLKLVLVGAMTDSDPQQASALIQADGQARRFYIGDSIPGGAVLHEVLADSVVLKREGRFETLFFPKASEVPAAIGSRVKPDSAGTAASGKNLSLRERLQRNPRQDQQQVEEQ
jgi:general secretion pathway protein C